MFYPYIEEDQKSQILDLTKKKNMWSWSLLFS